MNIYLLQVVGKWISLIAVSLLSWFGNVDFDETIKGIDNANKNKNVNVVNHVIKYDTKIIYNSKLPVNTKKIITKGEDGLVFSENGSDEKRTIKKMVTEVVEVGTGPAGNFVGKMTNYGPDCYGCSKVGNVACYTKDKKNHSLINDGIYYTDDEYGKVRIVSADRRVFPCGTIVKVTKGNTQFYAVVLDTGYSMRKAWEESGLVWMDLAHESQAMAKVNGINGNDIKYEVQRWGW